MEKRTYNKLSVRITNSSLLEIGKKSNRAKRSSIKPPYILHIQLFNYKAQISLHIKHKHKDR